MNKAGPSCRKDLAPDQGCLIDKNDWRGRENLTGDAPQRTIAITKLDIEYLSISTLLPYSRNARIHSKKQVKQIADSIRQFGFTNPILIDKDNMILAGHGRTEAAKLLEMTEVPCVRLEHMSEAQKRA